MSTTADTTGLNLRPTLVERGTVYVAPKEEDAPIQALAMFPTACRFPYSVSVTIVAAYKQQAPVYTGSKGKKIEAGMLAATRRG